MTLITDDIEQNLDASIKEKAHPLKPTLWQAFKLSVITTLNSLPVLLFAFFLLITQLMLLPKESPPASVGGDLSVLFPWLFCLLSVACLSVLFQAGWMHFLAEQAKKIITLTLKLKESAEEPTEKAASKEPELTVLQHLFSGIGQFGKPMLGYYALQLIVLVAFVLISSWLVNLIGIPVEIQTKEMQTTLAQWVQHTPTEAQILHFLQQLNTHSIQQISQLGMLFSVSIIVFTLFILLTSFLPSIIVTKQVSLQKAWELQLQLIKQYPIQAVFISSFQVVGGCLLPLLLPRSSSFAIDMLLYFGTYLGMIWSQAFPIAYLLVQTNFPKTAEPAEPEPHELDITV